MNTLNPQPVNFKFGDYISQGFDLLKTNFGSIFLATLFTLLMSIIPFCGAVAVSNLLKFLRKIDKGESAQPSEIFNFNDFMKYLKPQLLILVAMIVLYIPYIIIMALSGVFSGEQPSGFVGILMMLYMLFFIVIVFYFTLKGFYIIALMSLKNVQGLKEAWEISKIMSSGNLIMIFLFSIVVGFLGEIGIVLCGIGIFLTIPYIYTAQYFAYKDGIAQIENNNLQ